MRDSYIENSKNHKGDYYSALQHTNTKKKKMPKDLGPLRGSSFL